MNKERAAHTNVGNIHFIRGKEIQILH